ncbi:MAG: RNA methyltransferase substrate-binding domain-containing protein, partial [Acetatifactor sp.]
MGYQEFTIEGRNAVIEAYRSGKPIDKIFIQDGCQDGPIMTIKREAKKHDTLVKFVDKERLDQMSETGKHQGVIAYAAAYEYAQVEDILQAARDKGEPPFIFLLDNIEDPHNLGAIIRTANPVQELSAAQIKDVFDEEITNWKELGGPDAEIKVFRLEDITSYFSEEELG